MPDRAVQTAVQQMKEPQHTENSGEPSYRCSQNSSRLNSFLTYKFPILAKAQALPSVKAIFQSHMAAEDSRMNCFQRLIRFFIVSNPPFNVCRNNKEA